MPDWTTLTRRVELLVRLRTFPVAFKLLEHKEDLDKNKWLRKLPEKTTLCQLINIVRTFDWTVGATAEDFATPLCPAIIGLCERPAYILDGTMRSIIWCKTKADAKRCEQSLPTIPTGRYEAVILAPLVYNPFDPDIILVYGNPAQMQLLINAIQFEDYERLKFYSVGESSCADYIAQCYLTGKPALTIPCYGERRYGHAQDDELVMAIPSGMYEKLVRGLDELYKRGVRYPISYYGAQVNPSEALVKAYGISKTEKVSGLDL